MTNVSAQNLTGLTVEIAKLTRGNLLLGPEGDLFGVGDQLSVPLSGDYSDGILSPGEMADTPFTICLKSFRSFQYFVDVLATLGTPE
jgi:hypothetical protein